MDRAIPGSGGVGRLVEVVGERGPKEPKSPFFGGRAGFAEHDGNGGVADLVTGKQVGQPDARDVFVFENCRVALLDYHGGPWIGG